MSDAIATHDIQEEIAEFCDSGIIEDSDDGKGCVVTPGPGGHRLNPNQRAFARYFVLTGGKAHIAARKAGYKSSSMAHKCMMNPSVMAEVKRLSVTNIESKLPNLIGKAMEIALSDDTKPEIALKTIFELMDRVGLKPKSGPLVQVNNDNRQQNAAIFSSDGAQDLIASIWQAKTARLSAIPTDMTDTTQQVQQVEHAPPAPTIDAALSTGQGGGAPEGPPATVPIVTTHQSENDAS